MGTQLPTHLSGPGSILQSILVNLPTFVAYGGSTPANDDTIPQNTEGVELGTVTITPKFASSILRVHGVIQVAAPTAGVVVTGFICRDSTANAIGTGWSHAGTSTGFGSTCTIIVDVVAGSTAATTFKLRFGGDGSSAVGANGSATRRFGGSATTFIKVEEVAE